jgi:hypothetical protein
VRRAEAHSPPATEPAAARERGGAKRAVRAAAIRDVPSPLISAARDARLERTQVRRDVILHASSRGLWPAHEHGCVYVL